MTQQPFYPQPGYPQQYPAQPMQQPQGYPAQPQQPYAPPAQYPGAPVGYPQGQPMQQPPVPPAQSGSIDDYYNQPVAAGGPGISWKNKAEGTAYWGVISGTPTVQQDTDYNTKAPLFQKDGVTPKWVMLIPLSGVQTNHQGPAEFPDGEVVFYARGKDKEELNRAVAEAGCSGAPRVGAQFMVTLVQRKPNRTGNPTNVVQIRYVPPNGQPHGPAEQSAPAQPQQLEAVAASSPVQAAPAVPQAPQAPAPQPAAPQVQAPPQWAQPPVEQVPQQPQVQQPQVQQPPAQQPQMQAPVPPGVPQAAPAQGAPGPAPAPQPPAGMTPEAQAILAGLTGQQAGA